jgi:hypothetical protein
MGLLAPIGYPVIITSLSFEPFPDGARLGLRERVEKGLTPLLREWLESRET